MDTTENTVEVNKFARRTRHLRIFSRKGILKLHVFDFLKSMIKPLTAITKTSSYAYLRRFFIAVQLLIEDIVPVAPQKRVLFQAGVVAAVTLMVTSLTPGGSLSAASMDYSVDYISAYSLPGDVLVSDEDGYLIKINPQTDDSNRIGMTDYAVHTVADGENLSIIAQQYGVSSSTIVWENANVPNANSIKIGQKLMIPPVDGVGYKVGSGDTLSKISTKFDISVDSIIAQNGLESELIAKGQELFLPGAEPIAPAIPIASSYRTGTISRDARATSYVNAAPSSAAPLVGKIFIYPTRGSITQGYHAGHYAIDIADRSMPPIWSPAGGTITKVSTGTWGGGYGNHVVVDHGGGLKSLYAHMDSVNVSNGQWVNQGDVLGVMGNTGRVYGATGIHLHWEVIQDGVKQYPGNYY